MSVPQAGMLTTLVLIVMLSAVAAQELVCNATGPTCLHTSACVSQPNNLYQWCGACWAQLRCLGGVGQLFNFTNPSYPVWDDNKKNFEMTSTTCTECYLQCPPGPSAPPNLPCERTGPTCVSSITFCSTIQVSRAFQYCGNCTSYIWCPGFGGGDARIALCPPSTVWDDVRKDCVTSGTSTTCNECYAPCSDYVETTQLPETTTVEILTTEREELSTNGTGMYATTDATNSASTDQPNGALNYATKFASNVSLALVLIFVRIVARIRSSR